ncbi:MAG: motility protein A [Pirellulaceae bacterium]
MDIATVLGLIFGMLVMVASILIGGAPFSIFIDYPSIMCVFGGAVCAVMICFPMGTVLMFPKIFLKSILNKTPDVPKIIEQLVSLAEVARRDGLLALESRMADVQHPFIKLGVQMAVDGTRPEVIEDILRTEIESVAGRHSVGKNVIDQVGKYAPAFGMIGTLLGLVMMLSNMSDPSSIGGSMAVALLTTLYGAVLSNIMCLPIAEKLAFYNRAEIHSLELILKGVLAIQSGENPRIIEQKLSMVLHPKKRKSEKAA